MYGKVPMRIQFEVCNSPSKHSPSHIAEKYVVTSNLEAIKILGTILLHVFFINFPSPFQAMPRSAESDD